MNPGAYQFVPGGGFAPPPGNQNAQNGAQGQPGANPYNPYAQQQGGAGAGYYGQPQGGYQGGYQQGGYGGYQGGGYQQGGYGGYQGAGQGVPGAAGYNGQSQTGFQGGFTPRAQQFQSQQPPAPAQAERTTLPGRQSYIPPSSGSGSGKAVSLSIGGGTSSSTPAKSMSISIGGKKANAAPPAADKEKEKKEEPKPTPVAPASPAKKVSAEKAKEEKESPAEWDAAEPTPTPSAPAPTSTPAASETPAPAPAAAASTGNKNFSRQAAKTDADAIAKEAAKVADEEMLKDLYGGEEAVLNAKPNLNVVFIGHVDAGKSTMGGQLLVLTGMVDQRTLEKFQREAKEIGRESWFLSWALDSDPKERAKGKTVEVGRAYFETDVRRYTVLDAPGHKTYIPSMITGSSQADIAALVISARKGEFETGFERGGQTREHALLVKSNGINKLVVVINKMDDPSVNWDQERYKEIVDKITLFLKSVGYNAKTDVEFIPVSAFTGANMKDRMDPKLAPWHSGPSLLEYLDNMPLGERKYNDPFMLPVSEKYNEMGATAVGKIESGRVKKGDTVLVMPNKTSVEIAAIFDEHGEELDGALCGDNVRIRLKNVNEDGLQPGFVLTSPVKPVRVARRFEAQIAILDSKNIMAAGFGCIMHLHTLSEEVTFVQLLNYFDKKTGRKSRKPPAFAKKGMKVLVLLETTQPICVETFANQPSLGRFTLRDEGKTIGIGKVTKIRERNDVPELEDLSIQDNADAQGAQA